MNNEIKEAIEWLEGCVTPTERTAIALKTVITYIKRMDNVKFVTEEEIKEWQTENFPSSTLTNLAIYLGVFIQPKEEKRCRWTNGWITTDKEYTKEQFDNNKKDLVYPESWHPVKEEDL